MPTQPFRRIPPRRPWILAALAAFLAAATLAPNATAIELPLKLPVELPVYLAKGGKVVPPEERHLGRDLRGAERITDREAEPALRPRRAVGPEGRRRPQLHRVEGAVPRMAGEVGHRPRSGPVRVVGQDLDVDDQLRPLRRDDQAAGDRSEGVRTSDPARMVLGDGRQPQPPHRQIPGVVHRRLEAHPSHLRQGRRRQRLVGLVPQRLGFPHRRSAEVLPRRRVRRLDLRQWLQLGARPAR